MSAEDVFRLKTVGQADEKTNGRNALYGAIPGNKCIILPGGKRVKPGEVLPELRSVAASEDKQLADDLEALGRILDRIDVSELPDEGTATVDINGNVSRE